MKKIGNLHFGQEAGSCLFRHISTVHGDRGSCLFRYTYLCCSWGSSDLALGNHCSDNNEKNIKRTSEEIRINKRTLYSNANQQMGRGVDTSRVRCS